MMEHFISYFIYTKRYISHRYNIVQILDFLGIPNVLGRIENKKTFSILGRLDPETGLNTNFPETSVAAREGKQLSRLD